MGYQAFDGPLGEPNPDPWFQEVVNKHSRGMIPFGVPGYNLPTTDQDYFNKTGLRVDTRRLKAWEIAKQQIEDIAKVQASGTPTYAAGSVPILIPIWLQPEFVDVTRKEHPLLDRIRKVPVRGITFNFNQITAYASAGQGYLAEAPAFAAAEHTFVRQTATIKFVYQMGELTEAYIAASEGFVDGMMLQTNIHRDAILDTIEQGLLNGDNTGNNPNGLLTQQGIVNAVDKNSTAIVIADLREALRNAWTDNGTPSIGVTDGATFDSIKALIESDLRYTPDAYDIGWGIKTMAFEGVPIIRSRHMPTGVNLKKILFLDERVALMGELQPVVFEQLAKTKDSRPFHFKGYHQFITQAVDFNSVITEIP